MKLLSIFGTRPEAVKLAPVLLALDGEPGIVSQVCVTGQHRELLDPVLDFFCIAPDFDLEVMRPAQGLNGLAARLIERLDPILAGARPDRVIVQGDTTSAFAAALAAFHLGIPVAHVEAGLRTYRPASPFPEEANRRAIALLADLHFAPTRGGEGQSRRRAAGRARSTSPAIAASTPLRLVLGQIGAAAARADAASEAGPRHLPPPRKLRRARSPRSAPRSSGWRRARTSRSSSRAIPIRRSARAPPRAQRAAAARLARFRPADAARRPDPHRFGRRPGGGGRARQAGRGPARGDRAARRRGDASPGPIPTASSHAAEAWLDGMLPPPAPSRRLWRRLRRGADRRCAARPAGGRVRAKSASAGAVERADFLIVGGGVAGLSAGARLARHGRVVVLEGEEALGYHSSGRSVSFSHYGIGTDAGPRPHRPQPARSSSRRSRQRSSPPSISPTRRRCPLLDALGADMARFTDAIRTVDAAEMAGAVPAAAHRRRAVRGLLDPTGLKLDADPILQTFAREVRAAGGAVLTGRRVAAIEPGWTVRTEAGEAVRRADPGQRRRRLGRPDRRAGRRARRSASQPKRRTIIVVDPPPGRHRPAGRSSHSVAGDFYMLPEAGRLLVSPVDEVADDPGDAQPEDYDLALAADRLEHYTTIKVARIAHRWAGLRTFTADRVPTAGFAPGCARLLLAGRPGRLRLPDRAGDGRDRRGAGHRRRLAERACRTGCISGTSRSRARRATSARASRSRTLSSPLPLDPGLSADTWSALSAKDRARIEQAVHELAKVRGSPGGSSRRIPAALMARTVRDGRRSSRRSALII